MRRADRGRASCQLWRFGAWLAGCLLVSVGPARALDADELRALLRVEPGATCLNADRLASEVVPLLEGSSLPRDLRFVVRGSAEDPRSVRLHVVRDDGAVAERVFERGPERCDRLHAAVGLAVALAINAASEPEAPPVRVWSVSAAGLWTYRVLPQLSPGLETAVRWDPLQHLRVRASLLGVMGFDAALASRAGTFDALLLGARADACARARLTSGLSASGCAGLLGGLLRASGDDLAEPRSSSVPWLALSGAAELEVELATRWSLVLGLSARWLLHRVQVGLEDSQGIRRQPRSLDRAGFAIGIGPVYHF